MSTRRLLGLPGPDDTAYWALIREWAKALGSDGCSGPTVQVYVDACYEHDCHYRTHLTALGDPITRAQADAVLRERIQERSPLDGYSPMSWWRWLGVRVGGYWSYHTEGRGTPLIPKDEGV